MKEASYTQLLSRDAAALYQEFHETLKLIKEASEPTVRKMYKEDLQDYCLRAEHLLTTDLLDAHSISKMKILLSRTAEQWFTLAKASSGVVVPTF